uniref:Uncharacterized protein n=1 Tax=Alexandrium monilatum TaxID=311494 RepID=A0A7S4R9W2_9DINO
MQCHWAQRLRLLPSWRSAIHSGDDHISTVPLQHRLTARLVGAEEELVLRRAGHWMHNDEDVIDIYNNDCDLHSKNNCSSNSESNHNNSNNSSSSSNSSTSNGKNNHRAPAHRAQPTPPRPAQHDEVHACRPRSWAPSCP